MGKKPSYTAKLLKARADLLSLVDEKCGLIIELNYEPGVQVELHGGYAVFGFYEKGNAQYCSLILPDVLGSTVAVLKNPNEDFEFETITDSMVIRRIDGKPFETWADSNVTKLNNITIKRYTTCE